MYIEQHPFTLLEIILALSILTVIAALTGALLFAGQHSWQTIQENSDNLELRMRLDRIADSAFRNAIPFQWPDLEGKNQQIFNGQHDSIRLAYLHRINSGTEGGIRFLEIFQEGDELRARFRRYPITAVQSGPCRVETIARQVRSLDFFYAVREDDAIVWESEFEVEDVREGIPLAIRMVVEFEDGSRIQYLRRTSGCSGCSVYGKFRKDVHAGK